jgi:hypothetical protein
LNNSKVEASIPKLEINTLFALVIGEGIGAAGVVAVLDFGGAGWSFLCCAHASEPHNRVKPITMDRAWCLKRPSISFPPEAQMLGSRWVGT